MIRFLFLLFCSLSSLVASAFDVDGIEYMETENGCCKVLELYSEASEIVIPATVTSYGKMYNVTCIGESAFKSKDNLTSITLPSSITSIGERAFENCSGLTTMIIPNSVTSIEDGTFQGCSGLTSVVLPSSLTTIGEYAFGGCSE